MVRSRDHAVVSDRSPYRRALAAIAALGLVAAVGSLCFFTVDSADYAIVTDFGKPTQVITAPGLGFKHPLQSVRTFDHRLFVYAAPPSEFLTLEKTPVVASGTILWRVADPKRYFETVVDRRSAGSRLGDILSAELGAAIRSEEHTSELQSHLNLVCRLLLEKKKKNDINSTVHKKKNRKNTTQP